MAVLTERALLRAIVQKRIVSPILERSQIAESAINLRLGTEFIITRRAEHTSSNPPRETAAKIQRIQQRHRVAFGGVFVLHPGELVLGCTFEFIRLPGNYSALVLSRSSFGRIGLLVATAVYVHPLWRGCLTLELYNYGNIPIRLRSGAPVAQLVLMTATKLYPPAGYNVMPDIPVKPQFTNMAKWRDWKKLESLRVLEEGPLPLPSRRIGKPKA